MLSTAGKSRYLLEPEKVSESGVTSFLGYIGLAGSVLAISRAKTELGEDGDEDEDDGCNDGSSYMFIRCPLNLFWIASIGVCGMWGLSV